LQGEVVVVVTLVSRWGETEGILVVQVVWEYLALMAMAVYQVCLLAELKLVEALVVATIFLM
jgi:hypothetical protein